MCKYTPSFSSGEMVVENDIPSKIEEVFYD